MSVVKIVILNWNGAAHLRRFLPSVVRTAPPGVEIVVADNGSTCLLYTSDAADEL